MIFCAKCGARMKAGIRGYARCPKCGSTEQRRKAILSESFPFGTMRPFQDDVLEQIDAALSSGKNFILLEAPVGFGKSAIAATLCRHLQSAYLLTSTKQLQDQYSADFSFPLVMGKSNFTCCVPTSAGNHVSCSKGRCEADWTLEQCPHFLSFDDYDLHKRGQHTRNSKCEHVKDDRMCPYYTQKWDAFRAKVAVANYSFFLSELRYTDDIRKRKLLVCDEAHDLEKHLVGFASYSLKKSVLESYRGTSEEWNPAIPADGDIDAGAWLDVLRRSNEMLDSFIETRLEDPDMQDKVATAKGAQRSLEGFIKELKKSPDNWVVSRVRRVVMLGGRDSVDEAVFQPLEIGSYTKQLFDSAETVLLMSATLSSEDLFCRTFGIPVGESCFIRIPDSTFPVENRPIQAMDVAYLSRASMDTAMERIARAVDTIMDNHVGARGVVHTTSYQQTNFIMQHVSESNRARLVSTEGSWNRSSLLKTHGDTDASVLISPSLYQGVDLKDDLSRFQVVVKVPFPDLSERRTQVKLDKDPAWYAWQTALRLVQTYGRSVRSETDHATTYILDSNFSTFIAKNANLFPKYFLDAVKTHYAA